MTLPITLNTFHLGDCMDPKTGLPAYPDGSVDHVVTDPPFSEHVHAGNRRGWEVAEDGSRRPTKAMPMAFGAIGETEIQRFAREFVRVSRGWVLVFCALEQIGVWRDALDEAGARRRNSMIVTGRQPLAADRMRQLVHTLHGAGFTTDEIVAALRDDAEVCVWTKSNAAPKFQGDGPANAAEAIVTAWAGTGGSKWNAGGSYGHYHYPVDNGARVERRHETQKPLPLMRQILIDFTNPGDIVVDPFGGGGSTPIACKQLGRKYVAYELNAEPHALGVDALARATEMSPAQVRAYHRLRKDRAYAGLEPKRTAIAVQSAFDFEVKTTARRRARSLEDL